MTPSPDLPSLIAAAEAGDDLSAQSTEWVIDAMLRGEVDDEAMGRWLMALRQKGVTAQELVGAATAMRRHMTPITHGHDVLLDTCGTGGSGLGTFNLSTAVAVVVAACGVAVAKHGNRAATSRSGSADVLQHLGVRIESEADAVAEKLDRIGLCFCFAQKLHPAMRHVVATRRRLGVPTLFNLLGPLCNPAGATHQLLGTVSDSAQSKIAEALSQLSVTRAFVVRGGDGQDEVSIGRAGTHCVDVVAGQLAKVHDWSAADFGLPVVEADTLRAADPAASAAIIRGIVRGQPGPPRDATLAGAAAALLLTGSVGALRDGVQKAAQAIDDGAAAAKLTALV